MTDRTEDDMWKGVAILFAIAVGAATIPVCAPVAARTVSWESSKDTGSGEQFSYQCNPPVDRGMAELCNQREANELTKKLLEDTVARNAEDPTSRWLAILAVVIAAISAGASIWALRHYKKAAEGAVKSADYAELAFLADGPALRCEPNIEGSVAMNRQCEITDATISLMFAWRNVGRRAATMLECKTTLCTFIAGETARGANMPYRVPMARQIITDEVVPALAWDLFGLEAKDFLEDERAYEVLCVAVYVDPADTTNKLVVEQKFEVNFSLPSVPWGVHQPIGVNCFPIPHHRPPIAEA